MHMNYERLFRAQKLFHLPTQHVQSLKIQIVCHRSSLFSINQIKLQKCKKYNKLRINKIVYKKIKLKNNNF